jgi:hypothetical protein
MDQNYLRSLFALGFQGFLIIVCVAIYNVLVKKHQFEHGRQQSNLDVHGVTQYCCALHSLRPET